MKWIYLISFVALFFQSCTNSEQRNIDKKKYDLDNVNISVVKLYADQNSEILLDQLGIIYTAHFPKASISPKYTTDENSINAILKDSTRLVVLMRDASDNELLHLKQMHEAKPLQYTFAYDAIALVRNKSSLDSVITADSFDYMIQQSSEHFIVTKEHLDVFQHLLSKKGVHEGNRAIKVVQDLDGLQKYLQSHENAVGILPFSLISNKHSSSSRDIVDRFKLLGIKNDSSTIYPSQSSIYTKEWPLILPYNVLYCNLSLEDGVGFVKFIHTRQASKLILKAGLVPIILPERNILLEDQSFEL